MKFLSLVLISILILVLYSEQLWANPIVSHHQGANGRAETVHAVILKKDLNTGEPTSKDQKLAAKIRAMGKTGDDCGHIVANILGGPMQAYNLFPQNLSKNRGEFKSTVEAHMQKFLEADQKGDRSVDYLATLVYANSNDTRPTMIKFEIRFLSGKKLVPFTDIPVNGKHHVPANPYKGAILNP